MTGIEAWSSTAASNNSAPPNGWPEGQAPSTVNDCARQMMASIRTWFENAQWINLGYTHTYASSTSVTISGVDVTSIYTAGRRIKAVGSGTGTIYGKVASSSFSTNTTINFTWDSGSLSNEALTIYVGILTPTNSAIPAFSGSITISGTSAGPSTLVLAEDTDNGSNTATISAPSSLASNVVITTPSATGTMATLDGTETLTNKTISTGSNTITAATTSVSGISELATTAETLTGTDAVRTVTPAGFAGNKSLADPGYYRFPGGFTIQWGRATGTNSDLTITFPVAFATACVSVQATYNEGLADGTNPLETKSYTTANFVLNSLDATTKDVAWVAFGY